MKKFVSTLLVFALSSETFSMANASSASKEKITLDAKELLSQRAALIADLVEASNDIATDKINAKTEKAVQEFDPSNPENGAAAWRFLKLLSTSPTFISYFWQRNPFLIRSSEVKEITQLDHNWVDGSFTLQRDLRLLDGSYISGSRTDDVLRQGIKTDSWAFRPIKADPTKKTTWAEVEDALKGGTIYFNSAGSFWPNLGSLCRLTNYAFGMPTAVNIYITPPGSTVSVPPHTDRQDVLVFQTEGSKRWRVYAPPKRVKGKDPLNRGKGGDVLKKSDLGVPILDIVMRRGDVLYIPGGFPHTTDTTTILENETVPAGEESKKKLFDETSVHLTMGLDTHVWGLTYAHIRWTLLQRCGMDWKLEIKADADYWDSMRSLPIGFLSGSTGPDSDSDADGIEAAMEEFKRVLTRLEPKRWAKYPFPPDEEIREVITYMFQEHLGTLMEIQDEMFSNVDPYDDNTIIKGYQCTQKQDAVMQRYGAFSNNDAMKDAYEKRRLEREEKAAAASKEL